MRILIQRVTYSKLKIEGRLHAEIGAGLLAFAGLEAADSQEDLDWATKKILGMRIFADDVGKMNCSVQDIGGECLLVSQFTLHASTKKGNRPSYMKAAPPEQAKDLFERWVSQMDSAYTGRVSSGVFAADMKIELLNDGPVTIILDSKNRE